MDKAFQDLIKRQRENEDLAARLSKIGTISDSLKKTMNSVSVASFLGTEQSRLAASSLTSHIESSRLAASNFLKYTTPVVPSYISEIEKIKNSLSAGNLIALSASSHVKSIADLARRHDFQLGGAFKNIDIGSIAKTAFIGDAIKRLAPVIGSDFLASHALSKFKDLSSVLHAGNVYGESISKTLRENLGDWRGDVVVPIYAQTLYETQGFNKGLTDLSPTVFYEVVAEAGLAPSDVELFGPVVNDVSDEDLAQEERNARCYSRIFRLENRIRAFFEEAMRMRYGDSWFKQLPGDVKTSLKELQIRKAEAGVHLSLMQCTDFSHYLQILNNGNLWKEVFQPLFNATRKADVIESFNRLKPVRDTAMHSNWVSQEDWLMLYVETERLLKIMRLKH
ncbi:Swt1 family HEPN domain-containing protein [Variovorax sp. RB3P1]|uniref:Swt1 family HEPN domain-containing protein n=1 Tax=Variovorax sp. RB3P1 TaxID=3443732 RepID=UPI003F45528C